MKAGKKMLITIAIDFFIVLILGLALLLASKMIENRVQEIGQIRTQREAVAAAIDSRIALKTDEKTAEKYFPKMEPLLITKDQLINFSRDLSLMAGQSNFGQTLSFGQETALERTKPRETFFTANLSGQGTGLKNLSRFLKILENSSYLVRINSFDITAEGNSLNANFGGKIFSF